MPDQLKTADTSLADHEAEKAAPASRRALDEIAKSIRRISIGDEYDVQGIRSVWHRGSRQTEMLSWERRDGTIVKQEFCFIGLLVEFREGHPLRTGHVPLPEGEDEDSASRLGSHLLNMDERVSKKTLEIASALLRRVKGRDYYSQHLLKHINQAIRRQGYDQSRTVVGDLDRFPRERLQTPWDLHAWLRQVARRRALRSAGQPADWLILAAIYCLAGLVLGFVFFFLFWLVAF